MYFDSFDICEAYYLFARHYHVGGDTDGAHGNGYFARLNRLQFHPGSSLRIYDDPNKALSENGAEIYRGLVEAYERGDRDVDRPNRLWPDELVSIGRRALRNADRKG